MNCEVMKILESWQCTNGNIHSTEQLLTWIKKLNDETYVKINECSISKNDFWFYDDYNGEIANVKRGFFSIKGIRKFENGEFLYEQPIIVQPEIGYLGIICKEIDGVLNFLMQAKVEPGNVNCVQISPTIQATKSNFTRVHGGKLPQYFEYFENSKNFKVLYDQIQSEQSSRFYKKRNRNIIIKIDENLNVYENFKWMTLGQIKELMRIDNLVNMDTRTVLSGIPISTVCFSNTELNEIRKIFNNDLLFNSFFHGNVSFELPKLYNCINDYKMFHDGKEIMVPLNELSEWQMNEFGITCKKEADFSVKYYDIVISGREVQEWTQPLFKANGKAIFSLFCSEKDDILMFLVNIKPEIGSFDKLEIGPTVQIESSESLLNDSFFGKILEEKIQMKKDIIVDVVLSEEGGRFYHEENQNIIIDVTNNDLDPLPYGYFWVSYRTLNSMIQINNCLNIQLRNLLSLLKI